MTVTTEPSIEVPEWFSAALTLEPTTAQVTSDGVDIVYRTWGEPSDNDIVLVHGGAAHSRWWDHIAPLLATGRRVVALDLSGHGDSGRREHYSLESWAGEVLDVISRAGLGASPTVIGHSMGGLVTLRLAGSRSTPIGGAIIVDSPIAPPGTRSQETGESDEFTTARRRVYSSEVEAIARFRPVPAQSSLPFVRDHIAQNSVRQTDEGWTWKFDPRIFNGNLGPPALLAEMHCPVTFFRAEFGLGSPGARESLDAAGVVVVDLPDAGHAPMLDQPLALITGLRSVLAERQRI